MSSGRKIGKSEPWLTSPRFVPQTKEILSSAHEEPLTWSPLRNRTVDLLLTMNNRVIPLRLATRPEQAEHKHRPAHACPRRASASVCCHSI
jgi:hypothetical protein